MNNCKNCGFLGYFEHKKTIYSLEKIDYFCIIKGIFIKDLSDICECWGKLKNLIEEIVNKECDRIGRIDEIIKIV